MGRGGAIVLNTVRGIRPAPSVNLPEELNEKTFPPHKLAPKQGCTESFRHSCPTLSIDSFSKLADTLTHVT